MILFDELFYCLSKYSLVVKIYMTIATFTKKNISLGLAYTFRGLVHYHHHKKYSSMQACFEGS